MIVPPHQRNTTEAKEVGTSAECKVMVTGDLDRGRIALIALIVLIVLRLIVLLTTTRTDAR